MQNGKATSYWFCIYSAIEGLYQWAIVRGYVDNCALPKYKPNEPEVFRPYIYSNNELKRLFSAAISYRKCFNTLYPEVIQVMLKTTYCLGLRPSETTNLHVNDIDIANKVVYIRETKFYKSRMMPVGNQVLGMIKQYVSWRSYAVREIASTDNHLFLDKKGQPVKLSALQQAFRLICDMADVHRNDTSRCDVRLQDLRHTFATNRITQWYREGKDVQTLLPVLSTYLGHCNLDSTAVYITFTDSLLEEANNIEDISEALVIDFLLHLETSKSCSVRTRNQRLAAIHSFAQYVATSDPQYMYWFGKLKAIPLKRDVPKEVNGKIVPQVRYLEKRTNHY